MRPRRLPAAGRAEIESVAAKRAEIPSDKDLAHRWNISRAWVQRLMKEARTKLVGIHHVPHGTEDSQELVRIPSLSDKPPT